MGMQVHGPIFYKGLMKLHCSHPGDVNNNQKVKVVGPIQILE